jgi:hypothetical protein
MQVAPPPGRRDYSQNCCQDGGHWLPTLDTDGTSPQYKGRNGRSWTICPLLPIRRLCRPVPDEVVDRGLQQLLPDNTAGIATCSTHVNQLRQET